MRVVRPGFRGHVGQVVQAIPVGKLATYGDIATLLGAPSVARHVGWALSALPENTLIPWHRVVNRLGGFSGRSQTERVQLQIARLTSEGVQVDEEGKIGDLSKYRIDLQTWRGPTAEDFADEGST